LWYTQDGEVLNSTKLIDFYVQHGLGHYVQQGSNEWNNIVNSVNTYKVGLQAELGLGQDGKTYGGVNVQVGYKIGDKSDETYNTYNWIQLVESNYELYGQATDVFIVDGMQEDGTYKNFPFYYTDNPSDGRGYIGNYTGENASQYGFDVLFSDVPMREMNDNTYYFVADLTVTGYQNGLLYAITSWQYGFVDKNGIVNDNNDSFISIPTPQATLNLILFINVTNFMRNLF